MPPAEVPIPGKKKDKHNGRDFSLQELEVLVKEHDTVTPLGAKARRRIDPAARIVVPKQIQLVTSARLGAYLQARGWTTEALALLQPLAHWMHASGIEQASAPEILPQLEGSLRELRRPVEEGAAFLEAIRDQSGLLVSLGQGNYAFLHLSFQEYLAARHVQGQALRPGAVRELAAHFGDDRFERSYKCGIAKEPWHDRLPSMVVLHWNGADLPAELASLPPGRYVLEPVGSSAALSEEEETGLVRALASLEHGQGVDEAEMDARVASALRR